MGFHTPAFAQIITPGESGAKLSSSLASDLNDDMGSKQVRTEVPVDGQTISKYSLVGCTVDLDAVRKSLFYH